MPTSLQKLIPRRLLWIAAAGYLFLLLLSHLADPPGSFTPLDTSSSEQQGALILVDPLCPSAEELRDLAFHLIAEGHRVRMPRLPNLNDPSESESRFSSLAETLPESDVPENVFANGQAGAVALFLAADRPDRVASLTLVDASGVQEFALLGERHLNIPLYWISGLALSLIDLGVPHFGHLPDLNLRRAQLRLLRNSDRRSLRPALARIQQPVQLIETDMRPLPQSRNREHARLLPQSVLIKIEGERLMDALMVMSGKTRHDADTSRQYAAEEPYDPKSLPQLAGGTLFLALFAIALATLISEDGTCVIAGLMIANGNLSFLLGTAACLAGILIGDYLLFLAGRKWGRPALNRIPMRWMVNPLQLREAEDWFSKHANKTILLCRCIPGTRLPAFLAAGILGVPQQSFLFWFILGGLLWTPLFILVVVLLSEQALHWIDLYQHAAPALAICGLALYLLITKVLLPSFYWRGRRKLIGRWRRFNRPEYWPSVLLYAPVVMVHLFRSWRKGNRFLDFTACNPCMPLSGLVEESKTEILDQMKDRNCIPPYRLLRSTMSAEERSQQLDDFLQQGTPPFPVVVKPDRGQRGVDVTIAHSRKDLEEALSGSSQDWMVQRYVPGEEFGVFVILPPKQDGFLFGINGKRFPLVTGDGIHSLEDLILLDDRAVCQADVFLHHHEERLTEIPAAGEQIALTEVGNHSRGTVFIERSDLITPGSTQAILQIAQSLSGFHYGRLDIRVPSEEDFLVGRNIQVLEVNGVTSESTNLYDSRYSYLQMVRILLKQWTWASEIGKTQRQNGTPITSWKEIYAALDRYHQRKTGRPPEAVHLLES